MHVAVQIAKVTCFWLPGLSTDWAMSKWMVLTRGLVLTVCIKNVTLLYIRGPTTKVINQLKFPG